MPSTSDDGPTQPGVDPTDPVGLRALSIVVNQRMTDRYNQLARAARDRDFYRYMYYASVLNRYIESAHHKPAAPHLFDDPVSGLVYDLSLIHISEPTRPY